MSEVRSNYRAMWERLKDDLRYLGQGTKSDIPAIVLILMQHMEEMEQLRSKVEQPAGVYDVMQLYGWTCSRCGGWVPSNTFHSCSSAGGER